jgi:hypothetical protein
MQRTEVVRAEVGTFLALFVEVGSWYPGRHSAGPISMPTADLDPVCRSRPSVPISTRRADLEATWSVSPSSVPTG